MCKAPPWPECDECLADDKVACLQHVGKSLVSCRPGSQRPLSIPMESHHGLDLGHNQVLVADDGVPMLDEGLLADGLGQNVSYVRIGVHLGNSQNSSLHHVSDEVVPDLHVLHARVRTSCVDGVADGSRTVAEHGEGLGTALLLFVRERSKMMGWFDLSWSDVGGMLCEVQLLTWISQIFE